MDRWLDLTLVVDESASMVIWRQAITDFRALLEQFGAFRDLRTWRFNGDLSAAEMRDLRGESGVSAHRPRELLDPTGRRLILVVSDCIGAAWRSGAVARALEDWSGTSPIAVLQPLPERLWARCGQRFTPVRFHASRPGVASRRVTVQPRGAAWVQGQAGSAIPVLEMDPDVRWLAYWASLIAGSGWVPGIALHTGMMTDPDSLAQPPADTADQLSALDRVLRFQATASPPAFLLAGYLAAAPLSLPVMQLVQSVMLPQSRPEHLAEIFLGDLLRSPRRGADESETIYEFRDGVQSLLLAGLPRGDTLHVLDEVSRFLSPRMGSPSNFPAILDAGAEGIIALGLPFARAAYAALWALGGYYAEIAAKLEPRLQLGYVPASHSAAEAFLPPRAGRVLARDGAEGDAIQAHEEPFAPAIGPPSHHPGDNVTQPISGPQAAREQHRGLPPGWGTSRHATQTSPAVRNCFSSCTASSAVPSRPSCHTRCTGWAGWGKTQLAVEYAYRFATDYDLVWWIPAEEPDQITSRLVELAQLMGLPIADNSLQTVRNVLEALRQGRTFQRWLLIYDNAGAPENVLPYLPSATGDVLITSLNQEWLESARAIQVDGLPGKRASISSCAEGGELRRRTPTCLPNVSGTCHLLSSRPPPGSARQGWRSQNISSYSTRNTSGCSRPSGPSAIPSQSQRHGAWPSTGCPRRIRRRPGCCSCARSSAPSRSPSRSFTPGGTFRTCLSRCVRLRRTPSCCTAPSARSAATGSPASRPRRACASTV